jgi:hypothetical protein
MLLAQKRVRGNSIVKHVAYAIAVLGGSTGEKLKEQLKNALRLKRFSLRTEDS